MNEIDLVLFNYYRDGLRIAGGCGLGMRTVTCI